MDKNKVGTMMQSAAKVSISELNECITCKLCKGYFIDATTIIECLHTFCRSCIVRYLESNKYCPICDVQVHKTKPLLNLRPDKTIQDLVYKLVPRLYQNEIRRRKAFYESHPDGKPTATEQSMESQFDYILAPEETVNLTLHYYGCGTAPRYLRCPSAVLVTHLKKLIQAKYELSEHHRVDVFYNQDCLSPSLSLMDISYIYSWKRKDPLDLTYKIYECRAKKPKLETTDKNEINVNNSANNNNNNNWKEVQLRISENGEMSITGIEDSSMLELLDATENFKKEIVINEGKNSENFPKPIQADTEIGNSEINIDSHVKSSENALSSNKSQVNAQKPAENHLSTPKKDLPGLKCIGKSSASSCTTSTSTSMKSSSLVSNGSAKAVSCGTKKSNSTLKTTISTSKANQEAKKTPTLCTTANNTEASCTAAISNCASSLTKTPNTKLTKASLENKLSKNSVSQSMPKSVELSASLNLNNELSVIPLAASTSCVSMSSCGGTTTVFSTINKSMCSTKLEESAESRSSAKGGEDKSQPPTVNSKEGQTEHRKESVVNNIPKETKNLKRKCEEDGKPPDVPAKLPKPTILNHSIGLMNLSNNHPLKKHSKMNRNGEHLLRTPDISEKVAISTPSLTVNHVTVPQKHISMDSTPSKPIIINKNVSNLQINRPGTPKSGQRLGQGANVPCYTNKAMFNSVGGGKIGERNGEKIENMQGKIEVLNSSVNSISKLSIHHPVHHNQSYQTSHHTPIITPSQLPHHQHLNSQQLKPPACPVSASNQDSTEQKRCQNNATSQTQSNVATSQSTVATSHVNTPARSKVATSQGIIITSQINLTSIASSHQDVTSQSNVTPTAQKRSDSIQESSPSNKAPRPVTPHSAANNNLSQANTSNTTSLSMQNTPLSQASPATVPPPVNHAPAAIKTKPSTPIGYKTLRDPPKSWNSQINSQIARVNQNVKAQQLANAVAAASQVGGVNAQGRFTGDLKSVRPAKFFKGRNMPRYLGCPVSGVKPMYQVQTGSDKEKAAPEQQMAQITKPEKSEIKKHSIVKIDPKTLRPISEKAPETSNLSNISSTLGINKSQSNQELRISSPAGDLKINTSSVSIFNPLKLQSSPKSERKSPKSPHSPKVKASPNGTTTQAVTTSTATSSPSPSNTLSPKQHRDKTNLTFTPANPFVPNLTSPTLSPNQFLYPAGGFPSYDPRVMAAYHSLWYSQRMAAAAAAGFVPPPMPHAFGMNIGLNSGTTTIGQQQHNSGISTKHSTSPKSSGQPSPRGNSTASAQMPKSSPTPPTKKTKETTSKIEKSLETALNKLSQNKAKKLSENKLLGTNKQQQGGNKKVGGSKESASKVLGSSNPLGDLQQRISSKPSSGNTLSDVQQNRAAPTRNSTMSALEKLSHNKAIEILGSDMGGKKSPIVREKDGRNPPLGVMKKALGESLVVEGNPTPPTTEKTYSSSDTAKRQSPLPFENKSSQQILQEKLSQPTTPSEDPTKSSQTNRKAEGDQTAPPHISTPTISSELQKRLHQSPEAPNNQSSSDKTEKRLERTKHGSDQSQSESDREQIKSDQDEIRSDLVQTRLNPDQKGSTQSRNESEQEVDVSKCGGNQKDTGSNVKVTSSDKTDKVIDSSDIKISSSQNSGDITQNSSSKNALSISGSPENAVPGKTTGNIASESSFGSVASVDSPSPVGNSADSKVLAGDTSGNGETKSDDKESDKGGGETSNSG